MEHKALNSRVLVEQDELRTPAGIILPNHSDDRTEFLATVLSIGEKVDIPISIGDRVLINNYGIKFKDSNLVLIDEANILTLVTNE